MTSKDAPKRALAARAFSAVEDVVYLGLGVLLAGSAIALLVSSAISFVQNLWARSLTANMVPLLDRILLILLVVEVLYTVQVSFREHESHAGALSVGWAYRGDPACISLDR